MKSKTKVSHYSREFASIFGNFFMAHFSDEKEIDSVLNSLKPVVQAQIQSVPFYQPPANQNVCFKCDPLLHGGSKLFLHALRKKQRSPSVIFFSVFFSARV